MSYERDVKRVKQKFEEQQVSKINNNLRLLLSDRLSSRIKTSFIFAVAEIERVFEDLKSGKKGISDLNDVFYEMRKHIMDAGNNQIRLNQQELEMYDIKLRSVVFKTDNKGQSK